MSRCHVDCGSTPGAGCPAADATHAERLIREAGEWVAGDSLISAVTRLISAAARGDQMAAEMVKAVNERAEASLNWERLQLKTLERTEAAHVAMAGFIAEVDSAAQHFDSRGKGGQQVPFFGDFASVAPSTLGCLKWWARRFREVCS